MILLGAVFLVCAVLVRACPSAEEDSALRRPHEREDLYALLNEANAAFQQANAAGDPAVARQSYDRAILLYERIIEAGNVRNAGLYYNLANAYLLRSGVSSLKFQASSGDRALQTSNLTLQTSQEDLGRAILNYRRAARLNGSDLNIKKNLAFARSRRIDRVETAAQRRVLETLFFWHYDLSLRTRFLLACVAFAVLCLSATAMIWRGRGTAGVAVAVLSGVLVLSLLSSILVETQRQDDTPYGVIIAAEVVARQGDGPNYPPSFKDPLHAGTEFAVVTQRPGWIHIRLSDGTDAWIPEDAAGLG